MKLSIKWHEQCLENSLKHLAQQQAELERIKIRVEQEKLKSIFYREQIEEAKRLKKDSFDQEKFMIKTNKSKI